MSNKDSRTGFWISTWWPVLIAIAVICLESTEFMGADHTSGPLRSIIEALFGPVGDDRWELVHHYIRKSGHFLGYGMVGLAWLRAWRRVLPRQTFFRCALLALAGTFLIAGSDEWHQTFLPNRTGLFRDVLLDCCGALVLITLEYLILRLFRRNSLQAQRSAA